jgi:outer membrane protein assembly factor BamB
MLKARLLFTGIILVTASSLYSNDWPQFRGPNGNASADRASLATQWDDTQNVTWKTKLPGRGASSPIVVGNRIYLTAYTGYAIDPDNFGNKNDLRLHVLSFDRTTGKQLWDQAIQAHPETQKCSRRVIDHGYATSTAVSDGESVFAFFGQTGIVAYSKSGKKLWQTNLGTQSAGFGTASSPVIYNDLVFVNASIESQSLYALNKKTGVIAWKRENVKRSWSTPSLARTKDGQTELVVNQIDMVNAYDPLTGKTIWTCKGIPDYIVPVPIFQNGILYCLGGRSNRSLAIQLGGQGDVTETHKLWDKPIGANVTSPVYADGKLYWSSDKGIMNCVTANSCEEVYRNRLPTKKRIYASIVRGGKHLYVTTRDQGVIVLGISDNYQVIAQNQFKEDQSMLNASPAISQNSLFLRSDRYLYCIENSPERK